jgi:hypothetical protein
VPLPGTVPTAHRSASLLPLCSAGHACTAHVARARRSRAAAGRAPSAGRQGPPCLCPCFLHALVALPDPHRTPLPHPPPPKRDCMTPLRLGPLFPPPSSLQSPRGQTPHRLPVRPTLGAHFPSFSTPPHLSLSPRGAKLGPRHRQSSQQLHHRRPPLRRRRRSAPHVELPLGVLAPPTLPRPVHRRAIAGRATARGACTVTSHPVRAAPASASRQAASTTGRTEAGRAASAVGREPDRAPRRRNCSHGPDLAHALLNPFFPFFVLVK